MGAHWTYPGSAAIMSCEKNWLRCLELRGNWKALIDQAGSLYLSTGRMMCFSLEMIPGSKYTQVSFFSFAENYHISASFQPNTFFLVVPICRLFVNNVWYIKILSPEDILKMGEQGVESSGTNAMQRMSGGMA